MIALTPDGRTAYVVNFGSADSAPAAPGTVTLIRTATGTASAPITVGYHSRWQILGLMRLAVAADDRPYPV